MDDTTKIVQNGKKFFYNKEELDEFITKLSKEIKEKYNCELNKVE